VVPAARRRARRISIAGSSCPSCRTDLSAVGRLRRRRSRRGGRSRALRPPSVTPPHPPTRPARTPTCRPAGPGSRAANPTNPNRAAVTDVVSSFIPRGHSRSRTHVHDADRGSAGGVAASRRSRSPASAGHRDGGLHRPVGPRRERDRVPHAARPSESPGRGGRQPWQR
jgi:hypothetical protein